MSVRRLLALFAGLALLASLGIAAPAQAAPGTSHHYYLSLGDSLAFGYNPALVAAGDKNPSDYVGYAEDYATSHPVWNLVNLGCPGETLATIFGTCPDSGYGGPLHVDYTGSQAQAAYAFLKAHPGQTQLITVDIGSNDMLAVVYACLNAGTLTATCLRNGLEPALPTMAREYGTLVAGLRVRAPGAQIVLMNYYNPLAPLVPGSDTLVQEANQYVVNSVAAHIPGVTVANSFAAINHNPAFSTESASVCGLTWFCTVLDPHPNTAGYSALAAALGDVTR